MRINTNTWNKIRYTIYTPWYDWIVSYFKKSRKTSVDSLDVKPGDKVLIIGAGTGLDLEFLPGDCEIVATDITPSMVVRINKRNITLKRNVNTLVMDGQALKFADNTFDKIILHLILAVIPDPVACILETERVLKHGGHVAVFDKFVPKNHDVSTLRKLINIPANFLATNITRNFESIVSRSHLTVLSDRDADFKGHFRLIKLEKRHNSNTAAGL